MSRSGMDRRALLHGAGVLSLPLVLGGCSKKRLQELKPHPDVAVLTAAIAAEEHLIALYEAVKTTHAELGRRLDPPLAHHRDHLSALRRHYRGGTASKSPGGPPVPTPAAPLPTASGEPAQALATLRLAERQAAAARVRDVERVQPGFAQLLASIGACEAGHAMALSRAQ